MKYTVVSPRSPRHTEFTIAILLLLAFAGTLRAQQAATSLSERVVSSRSGLTPQYAAMGDDQWNNNIGPFALDGTVFVTTIAPNGDLYIGGSFTHVGGVAASRIAKWDGTTWSALGDGVQGGVVRAIAFHGSEVIAGGNFDRAGSVKATSIARWSGSSWSAFGDIINEGIDSTVYTIAVKGNDIYLGGDFVYAGNQDQMNYAAMWDAADTIFVPLNDGVRRGMDAPITSMIVVGGNLYVGGAFTKAGGTNASRVARWDGSAWTSLANGVGAQGTPPVVMTLAAADTTIIVGGAFTFAGGKPMKNIAQWSTASSAWYTVGSGGLDSACTTLAVSPTGTVFAAGTFGHAGGGVAQHIAQWTPSAGWAPLGGGLDIPAFSLAATGQYLWAGGAFTHAGEKESPSLARWSYQSSSGVNESRAGNLVLSAVVMPNPVANAAALRITLPVADAPRITIADSRGAEVASITPGILPAGEHTIPLDLSGLAGGAYFCRVACGGTVAFTTCTIVR